MEKREILSLLVGLQIGIATMENNMVFAQKLSTNLPYDNTISMGIYSKKTKTLVWKFYSHAHSSIIYNSQVSNNRGKKYKLDASI